MLCIFSISSAVACTLMCCVKRSTGECIVKMQLKGYSQSGSVE